MKGATADPSVKTINEPKSKSIMMIGSNQNFFLTRMNPHKSSIKSSISKVSQNGF
jgi:hypothetical protein